MSHTIALIVKNKKIRFDKVKSAEMITLTYTQDSCHNECRLEDGRTDFRR